MADLHLVKTRSNGWIWWIVGIVAVTLLLMFLLRGWGATARGTAAPARPPSSSNVPATPFIKVA